MAHHLAELMTRADKAIDSRGRAAAKGQAVKTILRIWQHRAASDRINPLGDLRPVLSVLRTLAEEAPPWVYLSGSARRDAGRRVYDLLRRLTICLSLLGLSDIQALRRGLMRARRTTTHQSQEEREVVAHLSLWLDLGGSKGARGQRASRRGAKDSGQHIKHSDLLAITHRLIEETRTALRELTEELQRQEK